MKIKSEKDVKAAKKVIERYHIQIEEYKKKNQYALAIANLDMIDDLWKQIRAYKEKKAAIKDERDKETEKFIKKYPTDNYGLDFPEIEKYLEKRFKASKINISDDDLRDIMWDVEQELNHCLEVINYRYDVFARLTKWTMKKSDLPKGVKRVPKHVLAETCLRSINTFFKTKLPKILKDFGLTLKASEKKDLLSLAKRHIHRLGKNDVK